MLDEMDPKLLKQVVTEVYDRYPEFAGCRPKVRLQTNSQGKPAADPPNYLLTFKGSAAARSATGTKSISRYLRVVVDQQGKIIKVTTSR
jgi:hypothetical protein